MPAPTAEQSFRSNLSGFRWAQGNTNDSQPANSNSGGNPFSRFYNTVTTDYIPLRSSEQSSEEQAWFALSRWERLLGFGGCLLGAAVCFFVSFMTLPLLVLKPAKFALSFSLGSFLVMFGFSVLIGPVNHFKHLVSKERLPFSVVYFGSLALTCTSPWVPILILALSCLGLSKSLRWLHTCWRTFQEALKLFAWADLWHFAVLEAYYRDLVLDLQPRRGFVSSYTTLNWFDDTAMAATLCTTSDVLASANELLAEHAALITRVRTSQEENRKKCFSIQPTPHEVLKAPLIPVRPSTPPSEPESPPPSPPRNRLIRPDLSGIKKARATRYINYVPEEETIRNDYSQRYPKQQRLLKLKKESVNNNSLPPTYLPYSQLSTLNPTKFDVILIDPPYSSSFTWDNLQELPVPSLAADPSFVFLWVGSGAGEGLERGREILAKWGYRRCEDVVWVKTNKTKNHGPGTDPPTTSLLTRTKEHCLMGIRGTVRRSTDGHFVHCNVDTDVIIWEGDAADPTRKPPEMYTLIENFCLGMRRLELFGRPSSLRRGWVTVLSPGQESSELLHARSDGTLDVPGNEGGEGSIWNRETWEEGIKELSDGKPQPVVPMTQEIDMLRPKSPVRGGGGGGGIPDRPNLPANPASAQGGGGTRYGGTGQISGGVGLGVTGMGPRGGFGNANMNMMAGGMPMLAQGQMGMQPGMVGMGMPQMLGQNMEELMGVGGAWNAAGGMGNGMGMANAGGMMGAGGMPMNMMQQHMGGAGNSQMVNQMPGGQMSMGQMGMNPAAFGQGMQGMFNQGAGMGMNNWNEGDQGQFGGMDGAGWDGEGGMAGGMANMGGMGMPNGMMGGMNQMQGMNRAGNAMGMGQWAAGGTGNSGGMGHRNPGGNHF
ncbi:hypothetical protein NMY22_g17480 [Coprinellus aureogranulatus]|nr:hypothetical protein NMY22_g17480 [Coprinellus aureogranulatus]